MNSDDDESLYEWAAAIEHLLNTEDEEQQGLFD